MDIHKAAEDINSRLSEFTMAFERIVELNKTSISLTKDIRDLFNIWGKQLHDEGNPDHDFYRNRMMKKGGINTELRKEMRKISEAGGVVKDVKKGLIDFYAEYEGEPICLCWRVGEEKVSHWHPTKGEFSARRPLSELPQVRVV